MKLLLDQNISHKLVSELEQVFPGSSHVYLLGLHTSSDRRVWNYAKNKDYIIVTQDLDFYERSLILGVPPKVVWLRTGNTSTQNIKKLLIGNRENILLFAKDETLGCLEIY